MRIGRWLCSIGYHRWEHVTFMWTTYWQCARCHETHRGRPA